jgi:hypothetical protein
MLIGAWVLSLKARYKKLKARLGATGAGVLPGDKHANLLCESSVADFFAIL